MIIEDFDKEVADLINTGKTDKAIELTDQLLLRAALIKAGIQSIRLNNIEEAIRVLEWAMPLAPITGEVHANLASLYMQQNEYEKARHILEQAIQQYQENAVIYFNYGIVCHRTGRVNKAVEALQKASTLDPKCPVTHYQYGCALMRAGSFKEGLEEIEWRFIAHSQTINQWKRYNKPRWDGITPFKKQTGIGRT